MYKAGNAINFLLIPTINFNTNSFNQYNSNYIFNRSKYYAYALYKTKINPTVRSKKTYYRVSKLIDNNNRLNSPRYSFSSIKS